MQNHLQTNTAFEPARRLIVALIALSLMAFAPPTGGARASDEPEFAPIIERAMDFYDLTLKGADGGAFSLRDYAAAKRLVIVGFVAGWCKNSNQNGHVIKRLYDKFKDRGLGVVIVTEYSDAEEVRTHVNRIGIDYPVVTETRSRGARKDSLHYKYRHAVGDKRKWGTPFYVIVEARDIQPAAPKAPLARRVFTVSGEMVESEAETFIETRLAGARGAQASLPSRLMTSLANAE